MLDEHVPFLETVVVEQQLDSLARRQLAFRMLGRDALLPIRVRDPFPRLADHLATILEEKGL
jgi:hypothetical protein